jgi:uncharacterized protein
MSLRVLAALCLAASSARAVDWTALKQQGYLSDFAGIVNAQTRASLDDYGARIDKAAGAQLAFVILPNLQGEPVEDVAADLYRGWNIGRKNQDRGVLLLLVVQDRVSHLQVGSGLEEILPDHMDGLLLENMGPEMRAGQYGPALLTAAQAIGETIAQSKNVKVAPPGVAAGAPAPRPIQRRHAVPWIPILIGLVIFWLLLRLNSRGGVRSWTGMLLGNLLSRKSYSGRGGGGFGGYDSGGSRGGFGGFGGGDSGERRKCLSDW